MLNLRVISQLLKGAHSCFMGVHDGALISFHFYKELIMDRAYTEIQKKVAELAGLLMRVKSIQSEINLEIPEEFKHHWTNRIKSITEKPHIQLRANKPLDLLQDFSNHVSYFERAFNDSKAAKDKLMDAKNTLESNLTTKNLTDYWLKRMDLFYHTSKAIHQGALALQCAIVSHTMMNDSKASTDYFGPLQAVLITVEDQIKHLHDLVGDEALCPVKFELYQAGHHAAHSQSLQKFIDTLDVWVFNSQYKTTFWNKNRVVLEVDEALIKLRQGQIQYLQSISKNAPDDESRILAMKQIISKIETEKNPSRLLDVLRNKVEEYERYNLSPAMAP